MTVTQTNETVSVVLSSRGLAASDSLWTGTIDRTGRMTLVWRETPSNVPGLRSHATTFFCPDRRVRQVVLTSATASLTLSPDGGSVEGTVITNSNVNDEDGRPLTTMTDMAHERLVRQ